MKRLIYILFAAVTLTGCRINDGYTFEPTRMGKYLFDITRENICRDSEMLVTLLNFNEYLSATDDSARVELHNRYFYTSRICELNGQWHIINPQQDISITTNGKLLSEVGCEWSIAFLKGHGRVPTTIKLSRLAGGEDGESVKVLRYASSEYEYIIEVKDYTTLVEGNQKREYEFSYTGTGSTLHYTTTVYFDIATPTIWRSTDTEFLCGGWLKLWCFDNDLQYEVTAQPSDTYSQVRSVRLFYEKFTKTYYY